MRSAPVSSVLLREVGIRPWSLRLRRKERYEGEGRVQISWTVLSHAANGPRGTGQVRVKRFGSGSGCVWVR